MAALAEFEEQRGRLWGIAYRMTGSVADADDAVQDAWLRWSGLPDGTADDPRAYLTTVISRICYDRLTSARARREQYTGPWLPEPLVTQEGPEERAALDESVSIALLTVLERLGPTERTALILHDVFAVPFAEIAEVVGRSPDSVRQSASRARRRVRTEAPGRPVARAEHRKAVEAFAAAVVAGDFEALLNILDPDVIWRSDGGGKVIAARLPVLGAEKVARFAQHLMRDFHPDRMWMVMREVNGAPGVLVADHTTGYAAVFSFTVDQGRIQEVNAMLNPDKLSHLDLDALR
ncbi:RNA polymerase sigma factor SigJ [Streptomyces sp. NPDC056500]|uniref:RNA polymerase sigma factor SigJ n=1 Tax=Streptomyces sp. NPDC056500 TaxID=3345840 RepID=UPI003676F372